jgi:hypothetical protein
MRPMRSCQSLARWCSEARPRLVTVIAWTDPPPALRQPFPAAEGTPRSANISSMFRMENGMMLVPRQIEAVSAALPRWRAKNRAELSRS